MCDPLIMHPPIELKWKTWLEKHHKGKYTIHENNVVDVQGTVQFLDTYLHNIPFKFGSVSGSFLCHGHYITTLKNFPDSVGEDVNISKCCLKSLRHCVKSVYGYFDCSDNQLTTLEHSPLYIQKTFYTTIIDKHILNIDYHDLVYNYNTFYSPKEVMPKYLYEQGKITKEEYFIHAL